MDNFETVKQDGNDNVIGKNIIYKSHIEINIYYNDRHQTVTDSRVIFYYLLVVFLLSLVSTELYLNYISQLHSYLIIILLLCGAFFTASVMMILNRDLIEEKEKINLYILMATSVVIGILVFLVYSHPALFTIEKWVAPVPIFILLGVTFVSFLLGVFMFYQTSKKNYKPK